MKKIESYLNGIANGFVGGKQKTPFFPGLYRGKTGIAVFLCYYATFSKNEKYDDYAYDLIIEAQRQMKGKSPVNYAYGLSGVGSGIACLIQNSFFEADPDKILEDCDAILSNHITRFIDLSSFNQILGVGKYFSFRIKDSRKQDEIRKIIDKIVLLTDLELTRTPQCNPRVLGLLHDLGSVSEDACRLFEKNIKLFDYKYVEENTWDWYHFFHKMQAVFPEKLKQINGMITEDNTLLSDAEYLRWCAHTGKELEEVRTDKVIEQAEAKGDTGLLNGLAGIGLSCLTAIDKQHAASWLDLVF
jgi:hypothetical protein